jgi:hypothetical protein
MKITNGAIPGHEMLASRTMRAGDKGRRFPRTGQGSASVEDNTPRVGGRDWRYAATIPTHRPSALGGRGCRRGGSASPVQAAGGCRRMGKSPGWAYFYDHRGLPDPARPSVTAFQTRLLNLAAGLWQCCARNWRRLWHLSGEWMPKPGTSRDGLVRKRRLNNAPWHGASGAAGGVG